MIKHFEPHSHQQPLRRFHIYPIYRIKNEYEFLNNSHLRHQYRHLLLRLLGLRRHMCEYIKMSREHIQLFPYLLDFRVVQLIINPIAALSFEFLVLVESAVGDDIVLDVDELGDRGEGSDLEHRVHAVHVSAH